MQIPHHFASWASCLLQVRSLEGGKVSRTMRGEVWVALHRLAELFTEDHWAHACYHIWRLLERLILWLCHHLTIESLDDIILIGTDQSWRVIVRTTFISSASASIVGVPVSWIDAVCLLTEASITELWTTATCSSLALGLHLRVLIVDRTEHGIRWIEGSFKNTQWILVLRWNWCSLLDTTVNIQVVVFKMAHSSTCVGSLVVSIGLLCLLLLGEVLFG